MHECNTYTEAHDLKATSCGFLLAQPKCACMYVCMGKNLRLEIHNTACTICTCAHVYQWMHTYVRVFTWSVGVFAEWQWAGMSHLWDWPLTAHTYMNYAVCVSLHLCISGERRSRTYGSWEDLSLYGCISDEWRRLARCLCGVCRCTDTRHTGLRSV